MRRQRADERRDGSCKREAGGDEQAGAAGGTAARKKEDRCAKTWSLMVRLGTPVSCGYAVTGANFGPVNRRLSSPFPLLASFLVSLSSSGKVRFLSEETWEKASAPRRSCYNRLKSGGGKVKEHTNTRSPVRSLPEYSLEQSWQLVINPASISWCASQIQI